MRLNNPQMAATESTNGDHGTAFEEGSEQATTTDTDTTSTPSPVAASAAKHFRSSLDYKVKEEDMLQAEERLLTTKPGKRKNSQQQQQEELTAAEQQQQQILAARRAVHPTRARGSSGPPPRKYDLSDLEGMSEDQLLHALYADPELAKAASKAAEDIAKQQAGDRPTSAPTRSKRSSRKGISEHPEHLREMMDGGVPVMQWVILLVLLGAGLWQLRKVLMLPDTKKGSNLGTTTKSRGVAGKGKQKKLKKPRTVKRVAVSSPKKKKAHVVEESIEQTTRSIDIEEPAAVPALVKTNKTPTPKKPAASAKKKVAKKKKTKANATAAAAAPKEKQQPDALVPNSTNGSSSHQDDGESDRATNSASSSIPSHTEPEDDGGWTTVSKTRTEELNDDSSPPPATKTEEPASNKESSPEVPAIVPESTIKESAASKGEPSSTAETPKEPVSKDVELMKQNGVTPPASGASQAPVAAAKTNKKKTKNGETGPHPGFETTKDASALPRGFEKAVSTEDDAALAAILQKEEENFAKAETTMGQDDIWEEVPTRKKKGSSKAVTAA